jgi:hypothetical protein
MSEPRARPARSLSARPLVLTALIAALLMGARGAARADDPPPAPPGPPAGAPGSPLPETLPPAPAPTPAPAPAPQAAAESAFDEITLNNGNSFQGTIVDEDATKVVLQRVSENGGVSRVSFPKSEISTLKRSGKSAQNTPSAVVVREAWYLLRSGGQPLGTRHVVLRSVRVGGEPGFRIEETSTQFPQGKRIPRTRIERTEDTDPRFLPKRLVYRVATEPVEGDDMSTRLERSVVGQVKDGVWRSSWRRGQQNGNTEVSLPPDTRGSLGLREWFLRDERVPGLVAVSVLDAAKDGLVDAQVGFAALGRDGRPDEFHWVEGEARRIARVEGNEVLEETLADGVTAVPISATQAKAIEAASREEAKDPERRVVTLAEQGLALTLPGPDWTATRPLTSGFDAGWRMLARCASAPLVADARIEWNPEGTPVGQTPAQAEAALLERLRSVCRDLAVTTPREAVPTLPGAWRLSVRGTLRDTAVRTLILCVPRGAGQVVILAACPETGWGMGEPALDRLLDSVRVL